MKIVRIPSHKGALIEGKNDRIKVPHEGLEAKHAAFRYFF